VDGIARKCAASRCGQTDRYLILRWTGTSDIRALDADFPKACVFSGVFLETALFGTAGPDRVLGSDLQFKAELLKGTASASIACDGRDPFLRS
jgi:hypothetical protein